MKIFLVGGLICCSAAAALYYFSRDYVRNAEALQSIIRVHKLKDLAQLLDAETLPLVVAISGRVVSETPIKCELSGLRGVIVEERVEQHYSKESDASMLIGKCDDGRRTQPSALILSTRKEVPWYLDDGTGRVLVVGTRGATGFALPSGSEAFEDSIRAHVCETLPHLQGVKVLGLKRIEWALPFGIHLTVVGEASKDDDGTVRIQRSPTVPFFVSRQTIDEHIANFMNFARWCMYASVGLTVFGALLFVDYALWDTFEDGVAVNCEKVEIAPVTPPEGVDRHQVDSS